MIGTIQYVFPDDIWKLQTRDLEFSLRFIIAAVEKECSSGGQLPYVGLCALIILCQKLKN